MSNRTETQSFPALEKVGEFIEEPTMLVYRDHPESQTFAITDLANFKQGNQLFHYLLMRESGITAAAAALECIKTSPRLVIEDIKAQKRYALEYIIIH